MSDKDSGSEDVSLRPPSIDPGKPEGKRTRGKLLRAWVEISAWLADYQRRFAPALKDFRPHSLWVQIEKSLVFAYYAQCRCDPANTIKYFSAFFNLFSLLMGHDAPQELQDLVVQERARNRFTWDNLAEAVKVLGFGRDARLGVDFDDDIPEDFIVNAWRDVIKSTWNDAANGTAKWREANDALRMVAEARGSAELLKLWEKEQSGGMTPERAYQTLEVPKDVDDAMLITIFAMRLEDQPSQMDKMREALAVIAEFRDSTRLREFLKTGADPGDIITPTRPDWPRGLNQLGNTCYLNSLLQYFFTIRDLRDAVEPLLNASLKSLDDDKLTDDDLKRHRVGGRLVTRREIMRSKKFVSQLADLFWHMEHCETPSVTPTVELAKLALVTSKDEEEDDVDRGGTDSSNDTDATLVEDTPMHTAVASPIEGSSSVLGKRARDPDRRDVDMDVDTQVGDTDKENFDMLSDSASPHRAGSGSPQKASSGSSGKERSPEKKDMDVDVQVGTEAGKEVVSKQAAPARKSAESVMMFGRQHDVSECMDNCMFQIETALLRFDGMDGTEEGKTSIVKRLFYGTLKQRLTMIPDDSGSQPSVHEKEDLFSLLPVNVSDEGYDLYDGLSRYFDDVVEFESKKARMEVTLVDLPPVLQIQLQRAQFDRETMQPYKSQAYVKFGETLYMDRFLDSANPEKKERSKAIHSELSAIRDRIHLLTTGKHAPFGSALTSTHEFLQKQEAVDLPEVDDEFILLLSSEQDYLRVELEELRSRASKLKQELDGIWENERETAYELTSVFIHRGSSPSWGHYFFYSRHLPENPDSWFKYNDSDVSVVSKDEVLADTTGSTANPYMLVYVRKGSEMINTVKRFDLAALEDS
ncbi:hypothetical protein EWM64_g5551 [Hericium alpestre]|uniref:Ubiquitin carboxyl-terminal hydrolase n=1 Tax=Hericium alpestre TaxID=135208 RepID=A0A4Y9ZX20_9AGAM|nr:hypothetical protein EWM64_g5551 [Hericium alpestre]